MNPQSVKCLTHSQQLPHVSCGAGALIKGCFAPVLVVKGGLHKAFGPISARQPCYMCMPMRPNKAETAVQGCHTWVRSPLGSCLGDMAVCTSDRGLVFERVTCFCCSKRVTFLVDCVKCVSIPTIKNRMTHPLQVAKNCTTHPLPRVQKLMTHPLSAPAHPPLYFLTSPFYSSKGDPLRVKGLKNYLP